MTEAWGINKNYEKGYRLYYMKDALKILLNQILASSGSINKTKNGYKRVENTFFFKYQSLFLSYYIIHFFWSKAVLIATTKTYH